MSITIFNSKKQLVRTSSSDFPLVFIGLRKQRAKFSVEVTSSDDLLGEALGSGQYDDGNVIKLEAVPLEDAEFIQWSDGNKNRVRWIEVLEDIELIAQFQKKTKKCIAYYLPNKDYVNPQ